MTKGKPWPVEDERKLRNQAKAGLDLDDLVASFGKKYTKNAVYQKITDLGLKKTKAKIHDVPPSSKSAKLTLPKELPSMEESLKTLKAASDALQSSDLTRTDVIRLRSVILAEKIYQEQFPKYVKYRDLEAEVVELRRELGSKNAKKDTQST